jgi:VanZ family protein
MQKIWLKFCFFGYALLLTTVSLLPADALSAATTINDKVAHFGCYAVFAILAAVLSLNSRRYGLLCIGLALYGLLLEGAQSFVPGRDSSLLDALANTAGVALGYIVLRLYNHKAPPL